MFWPWKEGKSNMARLGGFSTYISLCGYREIKNSSGTEDSSWTLATEKINLPCTLASLYFIYQLRECLPSVVLEPQITWCYCPRAAVTSFYTAQEKRKRPGMDYCISAIHEIHCFIPSIVHILSWHKCLACASVVFSVIDTASKSHSPNTLSKPLKLNYQRPNKRNNPLSHYYIRCIQKEEFWRFFKIY